MKSSFTIRSEVIGDIRNVADDVSYGRQPDENILSLVCSDAGVIFDDELDRAVVERGGGDWFTVNLNTRAGFTMVFERLIEYVSLAGVENLHRYDKFRAAWLKRKRA